MSAQKLILMRHGKSLWDDPLQEDHDRTLNERGRKSALAIGQWLVSKGHLPDLVICSSAMRTRETLQGASAAFPVEPEVRYDDALYLAEPDMMLKILRTADADTVMMVGHNPGCGYMASTLASEPPQHPQFRSYPTAATGVFEFAGDRWADVSWGQGSLVDFVVPRDLGIN